LFSIPNVWRYERPQRGRLREHWQLNVDLFGVENSSADHEIISVADTIMQNFGAKRRDYTIKINSRELMAFLLRDYLKLDQTEATTIIKLLDKMPKMDYAEFTALVSASISPSQREEQATDEKLLVLLEAHSIDELPPEAQSHPSALRLLDIVDTLKNQGVTNLVFDMSIIRGFMYYTDIVFEIFDNHPANNRSMFGGGRYDGLVANFGVEPVATVGFGLGDVTIRDFLETHGILPKIPTDVHVTMVLVGNVYNQAQKMINRIRAEGVNLSVDATDRKLDKKLKNVDKSGVRYAIIMGEGELADDRLTLKDMTTGKQEKHSIERTVSIVMDSIEPSELVD
jgi:histidyl-tRNA synthetase